MSLLGNSSEQDTEELRRPEWKEGAIKPMREEFQPIWPDDRQSACEKHGANIMRRFAVRISALKFKG
jgi:hypothetical protein